ncbi:hypothetical protein EUA61_02235 [TM7 phylum sp. oral taxon 346]|nr:hypothetical protein EUA61_02235 [TM7 phylum sp. oral taxon 346]
MITRERFPSHEAPDNTPGKSFDYEKYGISPTVESNSFDNDSGMPHEWTPAGRAEKVNDARDAVAIAFGDKPPAMARQESNTGRQLLVGEAYKAATDGGIAPTNERAFTRRVFMTGEKITGKLPSHADAERGPQSVDEMLDRRADLLAKGVPEDMVDSIVMGEHSKDRGDNLVQYASRPPVEHAAYEQPVIHEEPKELVSRETNASATMPEAEETPLPPRAEISKAETAAAKLSSEPEPKAPKESTPPETVRNESPKVEATETKPATSDRTAEKNPAEQVAQPAEDKTSPVEQSDGNQKNTVESEADVSKTDEKQVAGEQNTTKPGERQKRANKWAGDFLRAYGGFLEQNVRAELADRLKAKGGLNVDAKTLQAMSILAKEAGPRSPIWQVMPGSGSTIRRAADEARSRLQSIVESL